MTSTRTTGTRTSFKATTRNFTTSSPSSSSYSKKIVLLLRWVYDFIRYLLWLPYHLLVNAIGNFLADILEHPRIQTIAASTMAKGMSLHMEDPNFARRAAKIYIELQEDADMSRQLGEQFPKIAASFIAGAARGLKRQASLSKLKQSLSKDNSTATTTARPPSPPIPSDANSTCSNDYENSSPIIKNEPSSSQEEHDPLFIPETPKQQQPTLEANSNNSKDDVVIKLSFPWQGFGSPGGTMKSNGGGGVGVGVGVGVGGGGGGGDDDDGDDGDDGDGSGSGNNINHIQQATGFSSSRRRGQRQHQPPENDITTVIDDDEDVNNINNNNKEVDAILKFWKGAFERKPSKDDASTTDNDDDNDVGNIVQVPQEKTNNTSSRNKKNNRNAQTTKTTKLEETNNIKEDAILKFFQEAFDNSKKKLQQHHQQQQQ